MQIRRTREGPLALRSFSQAELLLVLDVDPSCTKKVVLVGQSMGGGIAAGFADCFPKMVHKIVLVAPTGLPGPMPLLGKLVKVPGIGEVAGVCPPCVILPLPF